MAALKEKSIWGRKEPIERYQSTSIFQLTNAELKFENNFGPFTIVHGYLKNLDPDLYSKSRWPSNADPDPKHCRKLPVPSQNMLKTLYTWLARS